MSRVDLQSVRCTASSCSCACFRPGSGRLRSCGGCGHGWVAHALQKLQAPPPSSCGPVEVALPGLVFHLSSLILYGAQAVPVRLKILLDRLYSVLTPEQVGHTLHTLGWSLGDYVRGYMLQYPGGKVLDRWLMVTREEELLILKQFLRFGETRPIVELMTAVSRFSELELDAVPKSCRSGVERNGTSPGPVRSTTGDSCPVASISRPADHGVQHLKSFPRLSLLLPVTVPGSEVHGVIPSTEHLPKPGGTKLTPGQDGSILLKIKVDPDKLQGHQPHREPDLSRGATTSEVSSPLAPTLGSSLVPSSSSALKTSQRSQDFPAFHPLPSFSSSFLCPPPNSPFASTLQPLPSSLCSLPSSPAAGRKGRVCCGVCGKSFYDKGTLKIHYNAVHLKIKHRCTVAGCTMVFSSLRSRNRHSANPNPRLHTGSSRHVHVHGPSETHVHEARLARKNAHTRLCRGEKVCNVRWQPDEDVSPPPPLTLSQKGSPYRSDLLPLAAPPPRLLLPALCASSLGSPSSSVHLDVPVAEKPEHCPPLLNQPTGPLSDPSSSRQGDVCTSPGDSMPKKKPRKSSMPVKIERDDLDRRRSKVETC